MANLEVPRTHPVPSFVDAHIHLRESRGGNDLLAAGVVAARDAGTPAGLGLMAGSPAGLTIVSSGSALFKAPGYGSFFGIAVRSRDDISREIIRLRAAGAGIIKIVASGLVSLKNPGTISPGGFTPDELIFIVEEAGNQGLRVMAHANGEQAIMAAAFAGVQSIEHGFFMTEKALELLAYKRVFWVPTINALVHALKSADAGDEVRRFVTDLVRRHRDMLRRAHAAGVPLAVGTDAVLPDPAYQAIYHAELDQFERAGIGRDEVVVIASEGGAKLLEKETRGHGAGV